MVAEKKLSKEENIKAMDAAAEGASEIAQRGVVGP